MLDSDEFDVVILGTGLVNTVLSAALSTSGKKVLHIDKDTVYGGSYATLGLADIHSRMTGPYFHGLVEEGDPSTCASLLVDRRARLLYSTGDMVETLLSSGTASYLSFCPVDRVVCGVDNPVPLSKGDIFQNKSLTLLEKRSLMKFVHSVVGSEKDRFAETPANAGTFQTDYANFLALLEAQGFSQNVQDMLYYGVAHVGDSTPISVEEGMRRFKQVMFSAKRFSQGCFLYPLYGVSGLCEAMSRKSAIFGGVFMLDTETEIVVNDGKYTGIKIGASGQDIQSEFLVADPEYLEEVSYGNSECSHAILVLDQYLPEVQEEDRKNHTQVIVLPPTPEHSNPVRVVVLDESTKCAGKSQSLVYLSTVSSASSAVLDLEQAIAKVLNQVEQDKVVYRCFYRSREVFPPARLPQGVFSVGDQDNEIGFNIAVAKAKSIFKDMYPDLEMFPAPETTAEPDEFSDLDL